MKVTVRNNNVDKALSIFKRKHADKLLEVREREHYEKPTARRAKAKRLARIREKNRQASQKPQYV